MKSGNTKTTTILADSAQTFDYIIAGAGSSGLSLAWHMIHSELKENRLLVIDKSLEPQNDKTWCFWERDVPYFENLIQKKWVESDIFVNGDHFHEQLRHYPYYSIRSGSYRSAILEVLKGRSNVTLLESPIEKLEGDGGSARLHTPEEQFSADYIFQSCFHPKPKKRARYPLLQHFLGWEISCSEEIFDPTSFILMDFDETYRSGIAFMYVLPWSRNSALLEYTIFSKQTDKLSLYEKKLELYLYNRYGMKRIDYSIDRVEYGKIPMNDAVHHPWYAPRVLNLGTSAGLTKPSTGYTFRRIQNHSKAIVAELAKGNPPATAPRSSRRYRNYDLWLLQILHDHPDEARTIFHELFRNNSLDKVFQFLGEETTLQQDISIMYNVPWLPFFRAIWKTRGKLFSN